MKRNICKCNNYLIDYFFSSLWIFFLPSFLLNRSKERLTLFCKKNLPAKINNSIVYFPVQVFEARWLQFFIMFFFFFNLWCEGVGAVKQWWWAGYKLSARIVLWKKQGQCQCSEMKPEKINKAMRHAAHSLEPSQLAKQRALGIEC